MILFNYRRHVGMSTANPSLVESYDLTASPASVIWTLRVYSRMNIVIASPTARHVVIHPETAHKLIEVVKKRSAVRTFFSTTTYTTPSYFGTLFLKAV